MKFARQLILLILSAIFSYGLVVFWNGFRIFSFPRFLTQSLILLPFVFLAGNLILYYFPPPEHLSDLRPLRAQILFAMLLLFGVSIIITPRYADTLHYLASVMVVFLTMAIWCAFVWLIVWRGHSRSIKIAALTATLLAGLVGTSIYLYLALHSRLYGDDFCYYSRTLTMGYWPAVVDFYYHWSGRVSSTILVFSASGYWFSPLVVLSLTGVTFFIFAYGISSRLRNPLRWAWSLACAAMLPFLVYALSPDPYKSLFWIVSLVIGMPVLLLMPLFLLWTQKVFNAEKLNLYLYAVLGFLLAFVIATINEAPTVAILILTGFLVFVALLDKERKPGRRWMAVAALAGSLAGLTVTLTAPGNAARHEIQGYLPPPGMITLVRLTSLYFWEFLQGVARNTGWIFLGPALFLGYFSGIGTRYRWLAPLAVTAVAILMTWSSFLPGAYTAQASIPTRTQLMPTAFLVVGAFCTGLLTPRLRAKTFVTAALAVYLLLGLFFLPNILRGEYRLVPPMVQYAQDWDARDKLLRSTGEKAQLINVPWDSNEQKIQCIDQYYSLMRDLK